MTEKLSDANWSDYHTYFGHWEDVEACRREFGRFLDTGQHIALPPSKEVTRAFLSGFAQGLQERYRAGVTDRPDRGEFRV